MTNIGNSGEKRGIHSGKTIDDKYLIGDLLCQDTLGGLYRCADKSGDDYVIKLFSGGISVKNRTANAPLHPNILCPQALSEPSSLPRYVVFDANVTMTLREWMKNRLHATAEYLVGIMLQLTSAINAVHSVGQPVGDLCPETIFIGEDFMGKMEVYILDIDIAYSPNTVANKWYCAPEQLIDNQLAPASDVWALGAMVYETVYRRKPFLGKNEKDILQRIKNGNLKFSTYAKVPANFVGIIQKCLQQDLACRYNSMVVLGGDLLLVQEQLGKDVNSKATQKAIRNSIPPAKRISIVPPPNSKSKRNSIGPPLMDNKGTTPKRISAVPPSKIPSKTNINLKRKKKAAKSTVLGMGAPKIAAAPKTATAAASVAAPSATPVSTVNQKKAQKTIKKKKAIVHTPPPQSAATTTTPIDMDDIELGDSGVFEPPTDDSMENLLSDLSTSEIDLLEFTETNIQESGPPVPPPPQPDPPPPVETSPPEVSRTNANNPIGQKLSVLKKSILHAEVWQKIKVLPGRILHAAIWQKIKASPRRIFRAALWKRASTALNAIGQKLKTLPASKGIVGEKIKSTSLVQWARTPKSKKKTVIIAALLLLALIGGICAALSDGSSSTKHRDNVETPPIATPSKTAIPPKNDSVLPEKKPPSSETQIDPTPNNDEPMDSVAETPVKSQRDNPSQKADLQHPPAKTARSTGVSTKKTSKQASRVKKSKKRSPGWASNPFGK